MDADVKGALAQIDVSWKGFSHNGSPMTKTQVKAVLEYANQVGYKLVSQLKDREVDEILDKLRRRQFR